MDIINRYEKMKKYENEKIKEVEEGRIHDDRKEDKINKKDLKKWWQYSLIDNDHDANEYLNKALVQA